MPSESGRAGSVSFLGHDHAGNRNPATRAPRAHGRDVDDRDDAPERLRADTAAQGTRAGAGIERRPGAGRARGARAPVAAATAPWEPAVLRRARAALSRAQLRRRLSRAWRRLLVRT